MRINSGGPSYTSSDGKKWLADTGYLGGSTFSTGNLIGGTKDSAIYQSERFFGNYKIIIPNGNYQVTLKFAEIYYGCQRINCRVFNVKLENNQILTNFDIFKEVGGYAALDKTYTVTVNDSALNIDMIAIKDSPKISGIEITR